MLFKIKNANKIPPCCNLFFRMEGKGQYNFPTETRYEGDMLDGMFHGNGTLYFPNGSKYVAEWDKGIVVKVSHNYILSA